MSPDSESGKFSKFSTTFLLLHTQLGLVKHGISILWPGISGYTSTIIKHIFTG
jgi:hypothetical protein